MSFVPTLPFPESLYLTLMICGILVVAIGLPFLIGYLLKRLGGNYFE